MDNKELKGLSEAYNEVYLGELNLPFGFKPGEAQAIYNKAKGERATNQRAQLGVVKTNKGFSVKPGSNTYNQAAYSQGLQLAQRLNKETGLGKPKPTSTTKPSTGLPPRPAAAPAASGRPTPTSVPRVSPAAVPASRPVAAPASRPVAAPASRPVAAPASRPAAGTPSAAPKPPATTSTPPMSNNDKWRAANKGLATAADEKARIRGTSQTDNPLMQSFRNRLPMNSPSVQSPAVAKLGSGNQSLINNTNALKSPPKLMKNSYDFGKPDHITQDVASLYHSIYEAKKKVDQDQDGDNDFADVRIARMVASGMSLKDAIAAVRNKSYNEETELGEATAMSKRGLNEPAIRRRIAKSTGGGESADRATTLAGKQTYGQRGVNPQARENLARKQRRDFRNTTSSSPGLHGYAYTSNDSDVKEKQASRGAQRSALTPKEKKQLNIEYFELWVNGLLDEGYNLSEYTVDEMYEIFEETELERKKAEEERKNERRARVAEMQAQGRVMTPAKRAAAQRAAKAAEKREAALEKAAQAALNDIHGATGRVSEKPMGSEAPESKKAAPEATRRLRTGLKRDTLGSAADAALKDIRKEDFNLWVNDLLNEGYDLSDYTWDELYEGYKRFPYKKVAKKINRMYDDPDTDIMFGKDAKRRNEMMRVYSHMRGEVHPMIRSESPKKSKAKEKENRRKGEMKEEYNAYNLVIGHLLDEGFADDCDSANMMIERMSDEWLNEILKSKN